MTPRDAASLRQIEAAHPGRSTWLSANAGSGKTRVLTDRVARLLLEGVPPAHILCLTYTKAAASEMQNRLFRRLGDWAMLDDAALQAALQELGVAPADPAFLREARTLFARAIETPGGLRIQTIHSFCSALLRRFPLEAGISPQFTEIEDRAADLLRQDVLDQMASGPESGLVQAVADIDTDQTLDRLAREIAGARRDFDTPHTPETIARAYGLPSGMDEETLLADVFFGDTLARLAECAALLAGGSAKDIEAGAKLKTVLSPDLAGLEVLESVLLFGESSKTPFCAKIGKFPTKDTRNGPMAHLMPWLEGLMARVEAGRETRLALAAARRDAALHRFATAFLARYAEAKQTRGWLDFDDLIDRARALLSDPTVAAWVLYRLDGGIDHILVDEAQDTSPRQWAVIEQLAQEITAGAGARSDRGRTIFVVGDRKQSIYSFQGADAAEFDRMQDHFAARLELTEAPLQRISLEYSFRSAPAILDLVDRTFDGRAASGFAQDQKHRAFRTEMPGRVDLWPLVPASQTDTPPNWQDPVDRVVPSHHYLVMARRAVARIAQLIDEGHPLPTSGGARPMRPGDVLFLVRSRSPVFHEVIRACKAAGLPIAGADQLAVMQDLAVRDIGAVLAFLDLPEDSLSLATALRSPLFGLGEQALFDLAHRRSDPWLWPALQARRDAFSEAVAILDDLRTQSEFLRPYDLIERLLTRHDGRRRLLARLGPEAEDAIDALLAQALVYERTEIPSLTGFLGWMQAEDLKIKRQADAAGDRIRVMTVHGAKGLEAPVVVLPVATAKLRPQATRVLADADGPFWKRAQAQQPARQRAALARAAEDSAREEDRLLYVAMTRAECWLMVGGAAEDGKAATGWYAQIEGAMRAGGAVAQGFDFGAHGQGRGLRLATGTWPAQSGPVAVDAPQAPRQAPDWATQPPVAVPDAPGPRSPSDLGGAKALPGADGDLTEVAQARGTLIHLALEHLPGVPPERRRAVGLGLLARAAPDLDEATRAALCDEALVVLDAPACAPVFSPGALTEVAVTGEAPGLGRMRGVIDRLIVRDGHVTAVDFKSNRTVPQAPAQVPEGVLRQMGAYAALLAQIYPGHVIETGILWTATASYMPLPHDLVTQALRRAELDLGPPRA